FHSPLLSNLISVPSLRCTLNSSPPNPSFSFWTFAICAVEKCALINSCAELGSSLALIVFSLSQETIRALAPNRQVNTNRFLSFFISIKICLQWYNKIPNEKVLPYKKALKLWGLQGM